MSVTPADTCPVGPNPNANPARHKEDKTRWLAIREETVFLNDGILRSMGLLPHPFDQRGDIYLGHSSSVEFDMEDLLKIGTSDAEDLQVRLHKLCRATAFQMRTYHLFQHKILKGMWAWKSRDGRTDENSSQTFLGVNASSTTVVVSPKRKESVASGGMSSRVSLLLMIPLLKSQAALDPELASTTATLLLEMLGELPPMSLAREFQKPLNHLEELLEHWITEQGENFQSMGPSTMIGLSCARGVLSSFLKTIQLLLLIEPSTKLPVRNILGKLGNMKVRIGQPCSIHASHYIKTIPYDDQLNPRLDAGPLGLDDDDVVGPETEQFNWHVAATDGAFMFVSGAKGRGLSKIGTGLHGTIQGYVYSDNDTITCRFLAFGNKLLITGPDPDPLNVSTREVEPPQNGKIALASVIDSETLTVKSSVWIRPEDDIQADYRIVSVASDGYYFYVLRLVFSDKELAQTDVDADQPAKNVIPVYLDTYQIAESGTSYFVYPICPSQLLKRDADISEFAPVPSEPRGSRSIRVTTANMNSHNIPPPPTAVPVDPLMDKLTSLGIKVKSLLTGSMFTCGNYITLLTDLVIPSVTPTPTTTPLIQTLNRHFGTSINGVQHAKLQGTQIHIGLLGKKRTYGKQSFSDMPLRSSFHKAQVTISEIACTYDARNNLIWTVNGDFMDAFRNPGHKPPWVEHAQLMMHQTELSPDNGPDLEASKVLNQLFTHIGVMASNFISGDQDCNIGFTRNILQQVAEVALNNIRRFDGTALTSMLLALQAIVLQIKTPGKELAKQLKDIQTLVLILLSDGNFANTFPCDPSFGVYHEASKLFLMIFDCVYRTEPKRQGFIKEMLKWLEDEKDDRNKDILKILKQILLNQFTMKLDEPTMNYTKGKKWIMDIYNMCHLISHSIECTLAVFEREMENGSTDKIVPIPVASESTLYVSSVVNCILKTWANSGGPFGDALDDVAPIFRMVLNHCAVVVDKAIEFLSSHDFLGIQLFHSLENILRSSLIGMAVPQMFQCFCEMSVIDPDTVEELAEDCTQLYVAISHLNDMVHEKGAELFHQFPPSEDWSSKIEKPNAVQGHKICESPHPVRDSCKLKETLVFNGARRLYLKFDPKCSTQYDYDKLVIYAGTDVRAKRVVEFGGNFYGYGSRTGNTGYWPSDLVRVDGDSLTYTFEVRSGREQHSPENTVWGFSFAVYPIFDSNPSHDSLEDIAPEAEQTELPGIKNEPRRTLLKQHCFIDRLTLLTLDLMSCYVAKLAGPAPLNPIEKEIQSIFAIPLLSYVCWTQTPGQISTTKALSDSDIQSMRKVARNAESPQMRVKMSEIIRPLEFQQLYVQLCLNYLERDKSDDDMGAEEVTEANVDEKSKIDYASNPEILREIFRGADAIIRNLVALTELQFRFSDEVDEFICGVKNFQDAFFLDPNFDDLDMSNLAAICDVTYDANTPGNAISDISSIVQAFIESGSRPVLTKAEEVVEEIFSRMKYLLGAEKRRGSEKFWDCKDFRTAKRRVTQVHNFIAYPLENPTGSLKNILASIKLREKRAARRSQGVQVLLKIVECSKHFAQSLIAVGLRLRHCVEMKDISCTGFEKEIMEIAGRTIKGVVEIASKNPPLYRYAIALLCILPYKRRDENCLVESGLLELLDQLCAFQPKSWSTSGSRKPAKVEPNQIGPLAWSAFQVLAGRCSSWETTKSNDFETIETDHIALPVQISVNITNHLARATTLAAMSSGMDECDQHSPLDKACAPTLTESIQDVLGLLDTLRLTKLGQAILKQSPCICRLFSLLLDSRLSPRLVLTILRLLYTALPRVNNLDISDLTQINSIPVLKKKAGNAASVPQDPNPYNVIASLLLSKLADFQVVCGSTHAGPPVNGSSPPPKNTEEISLLQAAMAAEYTVANTALAPPVPQRAVSVPKKPKSLTSDQSCKERNLYLTTHDPARNFLSGEVAEGLAAQIIRLLRLLLFTSLSPREEFKSSSLSASKGNLSTSSNSSLSSDISEDLDFIVEPTGPSPWSTAVEQVLCSALKPLSKLAGHTNPTGVVLESYAMSARLVIASLSVLGSFNETIRVSSICWILSKESTETVLKEDGIGRDQYEWDFAPTRVIVRNVCNRTEIATVEIMPLDDDDQEIITASDTLEVPVSRLSTEKYPKWDVLPPLSTSAQREISYYLRSLFVSHPHPGNTRPDPAPPLKRQLPALNQIFASVNQSGGVTASTTMSPSESKTIAHGMTIVRLVAEVRTRATQVLSIWLRRKEFVQTFLGLGSEMELGRTDVLTAETLSAILALRTLAKESKASYRLDSVESQVTRLRLLYRDCTKPPKLVTPGQSPQEVAGTSTGPVNTRAIPPTGGVQVTGTSSDSGFRLRRISDSLQDLNFTHFFPFLGEIESESEVSFVIAETGSEEGGSSGYASPESSSTALAEYDRDMLFDDHSEDDDSSATMSDGEDDLPPLIEVMVHPVELPAEMPIAVRGALPTTTTAAAEASNLTKKKLQAGGHEPPIRGHVAKPKPESKEYSPSSILEYHLTPSATYDIRVFTGPIRYVCPCALRLGTESDLLVLEESKSKPSPTKPPRTPRSTRTTETATTSPGITSDGTEDIDIHELLVRSWEQRVFPVIRRRFRNESERRDGLEQIKGALLMGMIDIARQTVEFLYEENGGIPRDLHLPTLEEIKVEASRFTMERIKVGMNVMIRAVHGDGVEDISISGSIIPKYAVGSMMRTFGLVGEVLDIDTTHELVLVEVYVETEGTLLRFWYPLKCLERIDGTTKPPLSAHTVNMFKLHTNLVSLEVSLLHLYCRTAFLQILNAYNNVDTIDPGSKTTVEVETTKRPSNLVNVLEELDWENLQLRSEDGFSDFPLNGDLLTWNLGLGVPPLKFLTDLGNPSVLFYRTCTRLSQELRFVIERAGKKGVAALNQLTKEICSVIENAPDKFVMDEIPLDKEGVFEVFLPDTAFTVVSVRCPPPNKSVPVPSIKEPCVHVYGMNGGDLRKYALACYPIQSLSSLQKGNLNLGGSHAASMAGSGPSSCSGRDCLKKKNSFPTILVPTDRISCAITPQALPGYTLQVQGIPTEFPLALLYCEQLIQYIRTKTDIARDIVLNLMSILFNFLQKTTMPPTVKEWIFALLSETISVDKESILTPDFYSTHIPLFHRLFNELVILYEYETKSTTRLTLNLSGPAGIPLHPVGGGTNTTAVPGPSRVFTTAIRAVAVSRYPRNNVSTVASRAAGANGPVKTESSTRPNPPFYAVSSYLQFLMELCINLSQVAELINSPTVLSAAVSIEPSPISTPVRKPSGTNTLNNGPQTSRGFKLQTMALGRNLKPRPKLAQLTGGRKGIRSPLPETKAAPKMEEISLKECVEMQWFRNTLYAAKLLNKFLVWTGRSQQENFAISNHLVQDCMEPLSAVTATSRLFVIIGAPNKIESMPIETSITRALNETGGVYGNELWISDDGVDVVVEVRTASKAHKAFEILKRNQTWYPIDDFILYPAVSVYRVKNNLETGDRNADQVLSEYLRRKIFESPSSTQQLSEKAHEAVSNIFTKCYVANEEYGHFDKSELDERGTIMLKKKHILNNSVESNVLAKFVQIVKPVNFEMDYFLHEVFKKFGQQRKDGCEKSLNSGLDEATQNVLEQSSAEVGSKKNTRLKGIQKDAESQKPNYADDDWGLSLFGFIGWCSQLAKDNVCALWRAFLETGHDFRLDKTSVDANQLAHILTNGEWTKEMDATLVTYVDQLAETLRLPPQSIHPHEIYLEENVFLNPELRYLQNIPIENIRSRFAVLQSLNTLVYQNLLPYVPLHIGRSMKLSISALVHDARYFLFYNTKDEFLYKVLQHSAQRGPENSPPEIVLDPILRIGTTEVDSRNTLFSQAVCQLNNTPSSLFCVPPATGGDPPLPVIVKFSGEEVQGLIGSFRHFLGAAVEEFKKPDLKILMLCPSAAAGRNKDSLMIRPGALSYAEERLMNSFGQFIGVSLRVDSPMSISMLRSSWRQLLNSEKEFTDLDHDLKEADVLTYSFLQEFKQSIDKEAFSELLIQQENPTFQFLSMDGLNVVPLITAGTQLPVNFDNKGQFIRLIQKLREKELATMNRMSQILPGLASIIPTTIFFNLFTTADLRLRVAGSPDINLALLKSHTHYQVGVSETDRHILFFWAVLESMTPEELKNFVKFATNQERLPVSCPCQNHSNTGSINPANVVHVPPFPMKIAPIDMPHGVSEAYINRRTIRAETCLFLIRLPPYTTYQVTRDQLLFACNSRDDPLSG